MPPWLDDHLHAAPAAQWVPALLADRRARTLATTPPPRALRRMLDGCPPLGDGDDALDVLVHTGELWRPAALDPARIATLRQGGVLLDLAWIGAWSGALRLHAWRRVPGQRAAADRLAALLALGLREPQQWACATGTTMIVTFALRRA